MYGVWQFIYLNLIFGFTWLFLKGCHFIIPIRREKFFYLPLMATLPALLWICFSPIYNGESFTQLSNDRFPIYSNNTVVRPWGDTFQCYPASVQYPKNLSHLQSIVVNAKKLRVVGGGHSFNPLICTNETLISMIYMSNIVANDSTSVTVQAGATIEKVMKYLIQGNKVLHGFGSVQVQTVSGAFSTSQHGLQPQNFARHVLEISAVLADGTYFKTTNLTYWKGSLGLLGVIYEMKIKIHEATMMRVDKVKMPMSKALKGLYESTGGGCIWASWTGREKQVILNTFTPINDTLESSYPVETQQFESMLLDSVAMPSLAFFPPITDIDLMFVYPDKASSTAHITEAWSHHAEYGLMYSAYAVPKENCSSVIHKIEYKGHNVVNILVRYVEKEVVGCMSIFKHDSCVIDIYSLQFQPTLQKFHAHVESVVADHGGFSHWGKYMVTNNQTRNFDCFEEFKTYANLIDPTHKFRNNYTQALFDNTPPVYENHRPYAAGVFVWRWFTIFLSIHWVFILCFDRRYTEPALKYVKIATP